MNKLLCIYPLDFTTEFLSPIFNSICKFKGVTPLTGDSRDDIFLELLPSYLNDESYDSIIFLGHGCSNGLYGSGFNIIISQNELEQIKHKKLILFSCNSSELLENIKSFRHIGFGYILSSIEEIETIHNFHNIDLRTLSKIDISYLRKRYIEIWENVLKNISTLDLELIEKRLHLFFNYAIVNTLNDKKYHNRRLIADILFYINRDINCK